MKLTFLLLTVCCLQLRAESYAQQITLRTNNASMASVFEQIYEQTGYQFVATKRLLKKTHKISLNVENASLNDVLKHCFKNQPLTYVLKGKAIIIKQKKTPISRESDALFPAVRITGTVTDSTTGNPLVGVSIKVKNSTIGAVTNANGQFSLEVPEGAALIISYLGYTTKEIRVNGRTKLNISLASSTTGLNQLVVVGYGTQKKANLTGSVAAVSGDELAERPLPNVGAALQGLSPNLNIGLSSPMGGEPGSSYNWNIRGLGSINGNDAPLILVDGVEMDVNNINPQDIESVSILKDAAASAIYGSRAPFGVILITTKKGNKDGSISIQYDGNLIFGTVLGMPHMKSSYIFGTAVNQASVNAGRPPFFDKDHMERIKGFIDGTYPYPYDPDNPPTSIWQGRRVGNANVDFPYEILKDYKVDQKHNLSVSGGNDKSQYYISLGYFDQNGFYRYGYDYYKRYNILANYNLQATDWLNFGLSTKYSNSKKDNPEGITTVQRSYLFQTNIFYFGPNTPMYNIDGSLAEPLLRNLQSAGRIKSNENDLVMTIKTEIEPIKGWKTNISYNYNLTGNHKTANPKPVPVQLGNGEVGNVGKPIAGYETAYSRSRYSLFNITTSYERFLGSHYFKVMGGFEQEDELYSWLNGSASGLISEDVLSLSTALGSPTVDDAKSAWATQGVFARINYNFKEKYLLQINGRYDGSSRFAPEDRWGFFPSVSAGYVLSEESFWSSVKPYINRFKIRASYGSLGNQNVANYLYIETIPIRMQTPWIIGGVRPPYARVPNIKSEDLTWETITTANLGFDAEFLDSRLALTLDLYKRKTVDMIGPQQTLPYTLGTSTPQTNNASLETKGFELMLKWNDQLSNEFSYHAQISLGNNKSTILKYRNKQGFIDDWYKGKEVGEIWGYVSDELIQKKEEAMPDQSAIFPVWGPGDMKYKDLTGDGKITSGARTLDDHGDLTVIGNSSPRYRIGLTGGLNWKNFDFYMQWSGILKRDFRPPPKYVTFWGLGHSWGSSAILTGSPGLDYWRPADETNIFGPNTDAYLPKPYFSSENNKNRQTQSRYVLNAAYLRLRFLQIGYSIPSRLSKKIFIEKARFYISGSNLLTLTSLPKSIDPVQGVNAYGNGAFYPVAQSFTVGLNLTF